MLKDWIKEWLATRGYVLRKRPRLLAMHPEHALQLDASYVLEHLINRCPGAYAVQVGAFDGLENDLLNPYFHRFKLSGLLLEPQAEPFNQLCKTYADQPQVIPCRVAIADEDGTREMYRVDPSAPNLPSWACQLATFRKDVLIAHAHAIPNLEKYILSESVPSRTFNTLFKEHHVSRVDILQVDAEGYDFEILKMFPFDRFKPAFIRYEHLHLSLQDQDACLQMLVSLGYKLFVSDGEHYQDTVAYLPVASAIK